jgi:hypothetical protein
MSNRLATADATPAPATVGAEENNPRHVYGLDAGAGGGVSGGSSSSSTCDHRQGDNKGQVTGYLQHSGAAPRYGTSPPTGAKSPPSRLRARRVRISIGRTARLSAVK